MASLSHLASQAKQAAMSAGRSLSGFAKQAAEGRAFLSAFANAVRSQQPTSAIADIASLERGNQTPEMRQLLDLQRRVPNASPHEGVRILRELDSILQSVQRQPSYTTETRQRVLQTQQAVKEIRRYVEQMLEAQELMRMGVEDPAQLVRGQFPVGEPRYPSKMMQVEEEEQLIPMLTPGSSNVYSFWWIPDKKNDARNKAGDNGTLYVTYKSWYKGQKNRPNEPGSTYAYSNVNRGKYKEFVQHTNPNTAGWAVWDYLRVRGTRSGHQHPYRLTDGQSKSPSPVHGGTYVPRKATAYGFRARTLVTGQGMQRSTLSPRMSTSSSKAFQPYGTPDTIRSHATWRSMAPQINSYYGKNPKLK